MEWAAAVSAALAAMTVVGWRYVSGERRLLGRAPIAIEVYVPGEGWRKP